MGKFKLQGICLFLFILGFSYRWFSSKGSLILRVHPTITHADAPVSSHHPCKNFQAPSGMFPCPICYLPAEAALKEYPVSGVFPALKLQNLTYIKADSTASSFNGEDFTVEARNESFHIKPSMTVKCGFLQSNGSLVGSGSGFEISKPDMEFLNSCRGMVVASAIFGNYDTVKQPVEVSNTSKELVCFIMFVDEETASHATGHSRLDGIWRLIIVKNVSYLDNRAKGEIPKMLIHRLVPHARFSIWIDGKLRLAGDPIQIFERYLWRTNDTMAIPIHPGRKDIFEEAKATMVFRRYNNQSKVDEQMEFYKVVDGWVPYTIEKLPLVTDVPESCVIIREHVPLVNLFSCLWFNELDRFTVRDQLSFGIVRDKILAQVPGWRVNMIQDCERHNFTQYVGHRF